jgi:hypothetical protein
MVNIKSWRSRFSRHEMTKRCDESEKVASFNFISMFLMSYAFPFFLSCRFGAFFMQVSLG